ncbi:hypothetical protein MKX01_011377 [Papaver californicum]|nr:hypothetical protein MKX01_011377 [Papaver californicum]
MHSNAQSAFKFCRDFIPVTSFVLDSLEYIGTGTPNAKSGKPFDMSFALKVPKQWLKSHLFQEECVLSAIELVSSHFAQWSYHVSFPKLAAIPLIRLRKFNEKITVESLRRPVIWLRRMFSSWTRKEKKLPLHQKIRHLLTQFFKRSKWIASRLLLLNIILISLKEASPEVWS